MAVHVAIVAKKNAATFRYWHCIIQMGDSQLVTGQLVTRSTRHTVNSSQRGGQLVTSKQTSKHQSRTAAAV